MEFQKLIEERRTIRKYSPESRITKEDLLAVIRAAQEAPSWKNSQTGRYYCVMSEEMVEKVSRECLPEMNQAKAENASLIVTTFVHNHAGFQKDGTPDNELGNGWGCYDLGLQNENLILKAKELGYGTLIMGLRDGDKLRELLSIPETETVVAVIASPSPNPGMLRALSSLRELLSIPETETVVAVIAIGKAAEEPARPKRKDVEDIVRFY